ncbi:uncharacterized protein LOC131210169 [Anopheles bellator]|uniref:uncharacterized protein LOC131210169 n=1 Tax=Anopheles bellator TaxID=139047 RepID=UPI0026481D5E|nr:uncharacterized protein LOC131210169 [Anopheles bellator]
MSSAFEDSNGNRRRKPSVTYTREDLKRAINLIVERDVSIRRAAFVCNVPRTTLSTYLRSIKQGKVSKLHPQEEQALFLWMTDCCKRGFAIKKRNIATAAEALLQQSAPIRTHPFQDSEFGRRCYQKFVKRWLSVDPVTDRKYFGSTMPDWFLHIEAYLKEANLFDILKHPKRVFLCDELRFREHVEMAESVRGVLKKMTMLYTFTAAGDHLSPLVVYPYLRDIPQDIVQAAPKNCAIVAHEHGQVTPKTFAAYLDKVVDKFVSVNGIAKPVIVFVDEQQVDLTLHLHNTCKRLGIVLLGINPTQVVKPTANAYNDICAGWEQELPRWETETGRKFTLADCAGLMQTINQRYIKPEVLIKDFSASNLCPWNRPARDEANGTTVPTGNAFLGDQDHLDDDGDDDDDDDDEMEMEIERFLENVDGWSDGDGEEDGEEGDIDLDDNDFVDGEDDDYGREDDEGKGLGDAPATVQPQVAKLSETSNEKVAPTTVVASTSAATAEAETNQTKEQEATETRVKASDNGSNANGTSTSAEAAANSSQHGSNTDDEADGPPDDIDISINFIDFKRAIGSELTERFERKLEIENRLELANHAENVLYDIYRQFRCDIVTESEDDFDIVEIGDD